MLLIFSFLFSACVPQLSNQAFLAYFAVAVVRCIARLLSSSMLLRDNFLHGRIVYAGSVILILSVRDQRARHETRLHVLCQQFSSGLIPCVLHFLCPLTFLRYGVNISNESQTIVTLHIVNFVTVLVFCLSPSYPLLTHVIDDHRPTSCPNVVNPLW